MKKLLIIMVAAILTVAPIFANGAKEAAPVADDNGPKTITVWCWDPAFNIPVMEEAGRRYTEAHPEVTFNIVEMAKADVEQKIQTILASGTKDGLPDICLVEDYNVQKYVTYYPGSFVDLSDDFNFDDFSDYKTSIGSVDGGQYSFPFDSGVAGLFYRTDMLKEAGITAADLENITWDEFCDLGEKYTAKTGKFFLAGDPSDGGFFRMMLQSSGKWYFDEDGNVDVKNNEALAKAIEIYKRMYNESFRKPTSGWTEWVSAINTGDVPTITTGIWIMGSIRQAEDQSGLWDVAPVPRLDVPGSVNASNLGGSSWCVLENGQQKNEAIEFLQETFASDADFYQTILVNQGAVGSYKAAITGSAYSANNEFFSNKPIFETMGQWSTQIPMVNVGLFTYDADAAVMANVQDYYDGKATLEETLDKIDSQLRNAML
ncbi:MAG: extracellular solute-binding protein [Sphaerochaetaceae bacterium]|nr:extracellular solute-binding protein [Sphaerochaetaceae bacterium]